MRFRIHFVCLMTAMACISMLDAAMGQATTQTTPAAEAATTQTAPAADASTTKTLPLRGIWVEAQSAELRSQKNCEAVVNQVREMNVSDMFTEVRTMGDAYYYSRISPPLSGLPKDFLNPLGAILDLAHRPKLRPVRVHAVLNLLKVYNDNYPFDAPKTHLLILHPEWLSQDKMGNSRDADRNSYLDPGVPAVQEYLEGVVRELVMNYPIDGILFDGFRYMGKDMEWGYNNLAIRQYQLETNTNEMAPDAKDAAWIRWRGDQLTRLLDRLGRVAHEINPKIAVSVAAISTGDTSSDDPAMVADYKKALQNWPQWAEMGLLDNIVLTNYQSQEFENVQFSKWIEFGLANKGKAKLVVAVSGSKNFDSAVVTQMRYALSRGVDGVLLVSYQKPALNPLGSKEFFTFLGRTIFSPNYESPLYVRNAMLASAPPAERPMADTALAEMPQPVPIATPQPKVVAPRKDQADVTRALLGFGLGKKDSMAEPEGVPVTVVTPQPEMKPEPVPSVEMTPGSVAAMPKRVTTGPKGELPDQSIQVVADSQPAAGVLPAPAMMDPGKGKIPPVAPSIETALGTADEKPAPEKVASLDPKIPIGDQAVAEVTSERAVAPDDIIDVTKPKKDKPAIVTEETVATPAPVLITPNGPRKQKAIPEPPVEEVSLPNREWVKVKTVEGQEFVAQKVEEKNSSTIFRTKRSTMITVKNSRIKAITPAESPGKQ